MTTTLRSRFVTGILAIAIGLGGAVSTAAIASAQPAVASVQPAVFIAGHSDNLQADYPYYGRCNRWGCERPVFPRPWRPEWRAPWYGPVFPRIFVPVLPPIFVPVPVPEPIWEPAPPCGCHY